MTGQQECYIK